MWKRTLAILITLCMGVLFLGVQPAFAQQLTIYTPYTGLSVTPGESVSYDVDIINDSSTVQNTTFTVENLPEEWNYTIRADGNSVQQLSVRPNDEESITFEINVPFEVDKGDYRFTLQATGNDGTKASLPFLMTVSEQGTFKTEFTIDQPNMEGHADSRFSYTATLKNLTADEQHYALSGKAPEGWTVQFKVDSSSVTSVTVEPNETQEIKIDLSPPESVTADTYEIPITASAGATSEEITVEAAISGKYDLDLSTSSGNLSSSVTAGKNRTIELVVENTGTAEISDVVLSSTTPPNWDVTFDEDTIPILQAGEKATVKATVTAPDDAIAGDYVTTFKAQIAETSDEATFRMSVKTSTLWGFVAVGIILVVIGGLYAVFRKFGRR